jgi:hypothetical protein
MFTLAGSAEPVFLVIIGGGVIGLWIISATIHAIFKRGMYERSRREIAAYVAEGSMTPEDGERLLKAESKSMKDA